MKIVYDLLSQHGKFAQKCPIEPNVRYFFDDFKLTEDMFPSYIPLQESRDTFSITYFTKEKKKMIPLVIAKIFTGVHIV